jgi:hypothetical protein
VIAVIALAGTASCSPGTLPGTPSPIAVGGGGSRYNGTIITRRVAGNYTISELSQALDLSMVLREGAQLAGRFEAGESTGTLQGLLVGSLSSGTFQATFLISTAAREGGTTPRSCEGRGEITATMSGRNLSWAGGTITYGNCPGLTVTTEAQATAVSPIPAPLGSRANLVLTIQGGPVVNPGTCRSGETGFPFTVEIAESAGVGVTFDSTFVVEERRAGGTSTSTLDMPFSRMEGGERRTYGVCSSAAGSYQAFFAATDDNGNRIRVATPLVLLVPAGTSPPSITTSTTTTSAPTTTTTTTSIPPTTTSTTSTTTTSTTVSTTTTSTIPPI